MREKLLAEAGTEMDVLHRLSYGELAEAAGEKIASLILAAREGKLVFSPGSGGSYGKLIGTT
jgi:PHP family Zn ribbon phosphoesterase